MTEFWSNLTMSLTRRFSLQSKLQDSNKLFYLLPRIEIIFVCITAWFKPGLTDVGSLKILMGKAEVMPAISIFLLAALKSEVNHL